MASWSIIVAALNTFRKAHPALTHDHFLDGQDTSRDPRRRLVASSTAAR